jgi:hypothetical protein
MPKALDPVPSGSKQSPPVHEIFKNLPRQRRGKRDSPAQEGRVSFEEYEKLVENRPEKLTAEQVNYRKAEDPGQECEHCLHFYKQVAGEQRTTCEILRLEPEASIDPEWVCDFMTRDGSEYPYRKDSKDED